MTKEHKLAMQRIKIMMMALLAVFCVSAVAAVAAQAAVEGLFVNSAGNALAKTKFTGKNVGVTTLETKGGTKVECKTLKAEGVQTGKETGEQTVHFEGCTSTFGVGCEGGTKHKTDEIIVLTLIKTRQLSGRTEGVLLVEPRAEGGGAGAFKFECFGVKIESKGSFLTVPIELNKLKKAWSFEAKQTKGVQAQTEYENEAKEKKKDILETSVSGGAFEQSGQGGVEEVTFEEEAQLVKT
jgi:hypothetical protein